MDRTIAACAGLAINSLFADVEGWDDLVVQLVRTGAFWHVEVRRQGDVYANERGDNRVDVYQAADRLVLPAGEDAGIAGELAGIADRLDAIETGPIGAIAGVSRDVRALAACLASPQPDAGGTGGGT